MIPKTDSWHTKAHSYVAELSQQAWEKANRLPNGRLRKRHVPYRIPDEAAALVDFMGRNDEEGAKALMLNLNQRGFKGLRQKNS